MADNFIEAVKEKLKDIKDERNKVSIARAIQFAKRNKNCMIFLLDIKSDDMVAAYHDIYLAAQVKTKYLKRKTGLAKTIILGHGTDEKRDKDLIIFERFMGTFMRQIPDVIKQSQEEKLKVADRKNNHTKNHDSEKN